MSRLDSNLHLGRMKTWLGFGDLVLIFKVIMELNRSTLSMCGKGSSFFFENNTSNCCLLLPNFDMQNTKSMCKQK